MVKFPLSLFFFLPPKENQAFLTVESLLGRAWVAGLAGCVFVKVSGVMSQLSLSFFVFLLSVFFVSNLEAILVVGAMAGVPTQHRNFYSIGPCDCCSSA